MFILFDFDGTIANSLDLYLRGYNQYLTKYGRTAITKNTFRTLGFPTIIKNEKVPKWQLFWFVIVGRVYAGRNMHQVKPFDAIEQQIKLLALKNTLGIVTSNSRNNVIAFLKVHNLFQYFSFVESKVSYFGKAQKISQVIKKYNISKDECVYVGDETRDVLAAKKVGVASAAVTWGFEKRILIDKCQPDITITKISELSQKISRFFKNN